MIKSEILLQKMSEQLKQKKRVGDWGGVDLTQVKAEAERTKTVESWKFFKIY